MLVKSLKAKDMEEEFSVLMMEIIISDIGNLIKEIYMESFSIQIKSLFMMGKF